VDEKFKTEDARAVYSRSPWFFHRDARKGRPEGCNKKTRDLRGGANGTRKISLVNHGSKSSLVRGGKKKRLQLFTKDIVRALG